jgi:hypothetical protein
MGSLSRRGRSVTGESISLKRLLHLVNWQLLHGLVVKMNLMWP